MRAERYLKAVISWIRLLLKPLMYGVISLLTLLLLIDLWVTFQTREQVYTDMDELPDRPVALVPGTSKFLGRTPNRYYFSRIEAAAELFHRGKVRAILVSGDNRSRYYNEPITMYNDLIEAGVPARYISLDYAGLRTLDSIIRARRVFGQSEITFVSQGFHCERAIYLANREGIDAVAYSVDDGDVWWQWRVRLRETLARFKLMLDLYLFDVQPYFLGDPEEVILFDSESTEL